MYESFIYSNDRLGINLNALLDENKNVCFIGKEVAEILGYARTNDAIRKHIGEKHKKKITSKEIQVRQSGVLENSQLDM